MKKGPCRCFYLIRALIEQRHSMARANLEQSKRNINDSLPWNISHLKIEGNTKSFQYFHLARISINWNPLFQTSLHKTFKNCSYEVNLASQCSHLEVFLLSKFGSNRGISIDEDSGPLGYVLWCCDSRSQDFFTFIQIGSGHTVTNLIMKRSSSNNPNKIWQK